MITDIVIDQAVAEHPIERNLVAIGHLTYCWQRKDGVIVHPLRLVRYDYVPPEIPEGAVIRSA